MMLRNTGVGLLRRKRALLLLLAYTARPLRLSFHQSLLHPLLPAPPCHLPHPLPCHLPHPPPYHHPYHHPPGPHSCLALICRVVGWFLSSFFFYIRQYRC